MCYKDQSIMVNSLNDLQKREALQFAEMPLIGIIKNQYQLKTGVTCPCKYT